MRTEIIVVGGGLSGLSLATLLHAAGRDVRLLEARDRLGGRILSSQGLDLGPAWFWPGQPRMAALVERLGLRRFDQFAEGALSYEDQDGRVERGRGWSSMEGSWRISGGLGRIMDALARDIPADRVHLGEPVRRVSRTLEGIEVTTAQGEVFHADRVVLALPPRLAAGIDFAPALPPAAIQTLSAIPTWMAGQAKALALYDRPFWREAGLSGDATSRRGPLVEIHDASAARGGPFALFGFVGVPPLHRKDIVALRSAVLDQLRRIFGAEAAQPVDLLVKDWASDPLTATALDQQPLYTHPHYGPPPALAGPWEDRLIFGGTETAPDFGGYLEGALEAADAGLVALSKTARIGTP